MAELTDQEMNDHMDEYEDQVSVFPKITRCDQDHVQNHEKNFNFVRPLGHTLFLISFTRVTGTGYPLRSNSTS